MSETPQRFALRQKITMTVNRYGLRALLPDGTEGPLLAFAQQKPMAFKEQVTFYSDESKTQVMLSFRARQRMDFGATCDVLDAVGQPIGEFRKDFEASLLRSTWHVAMPDGQVIMSSERQRSLRDRHELNVPVLANGWQLDWRMAGARAVALDALQGR